MINYKLIIERAIVTYGGNRALISNTQRMGYKKRNCDSCQKEYMADERNLSRGWGLCCSKSCAASKREKSKPGYDPVKVRENNIKREIWSLSSIAPQVVGGSGKVTGRTSEGYRVMDGIAYDEFDDPVYNICPYLGDDNEGWDGHK